MHCASVVPNSLVSDVPPLYHRAVLILGRMVKESVDEGLGLLGLYPLNVVDVLDELDKSSRGWISRALGPVCVGPWDNETKGLILKECSGAVVFFERRSEWQATLSFFQ